MYVAATYIASLYVENKALLSFLRCLQDIRYVAFVENALLSRFGDICYIIKSAFLVS